RLRTVPVTSGQAPSPLEPPQSPDLLDPSFGDPIGRLVSGYPFLRREREEADERVIDIARLSHRLVPVPPLQLPVHVDEAARVDHVVRRVQDSALMESQPMPGFGEDVVRGARDDLDPEPID